MSYYDKAVDIDELVGKTIVDMTGLQKESEEVRIFTSEGNEYLFYHSQDCCESVYLNDFDGNAEDFEGALVISAEVVEDEGGDPKPEYPDCWTWTFYKIETSKGGLWMRWLGESNGYYSETVDFAWVNKPED